MKKTMSVSVEVPSGLEVSLARGIMTVKGPKGQISKEMLYPGIKTEKEGSIIKISCEAGSKIEKAIVGAFAAHTKNMIRGVTEGFQYKLKAVFSHFPITLKIAGNNIEINNFYGEKAPRKARIIEGTKVILQKEFVTLEGIDREALGQTAANLELATRVKRKDTRVFQDGVYVIEKP